MRTHIDHRPAAETWELPALPDIDHASSLPPQLVYAPVLVTGQVCDHSELRDGAQKLCYIAQAAGHTQGTQDSNCLLTVMFIAGLVTKMETNQVPIEW